MMICHICKQDHDYKNCPNKYQVFKHINNRWLTTGLFLETYKNSNSEKEQNRRDWVIYTLMPFEVDGHLSLYQLYLGYDDLTEYKFAKECLGGWDHWQTILNSGNERLLDAIATWRSELEAKLKSDAFDRIKNEAEADGRNGFAANRYIIERSWAGDFIKPKPKEEKKRGRPSKQEVSAATAEIIQSNKQINNDFERLIRTPILVSDNGTIEERPDSTESA